MTKDNIIVANLYVIVIKRLRRTQKTIFSKQETY